MVCFGALACIAGGLLYSKIQRQKSWNEIARTARNSELKPSTLKELLSLSPAEVERCDIRGHCLMAMGHTPEAVASHATAVRFAPQCAAYQMVLSMAQKEAWMKSQPAVAMPPDPVLQSQQLIGRDIDRMGMKMAVRRAEAMSRSRRGE